MHLTIILSDREKTSKICLGSGAIIFMCRPQWVFMRAKQQSDLDRAFLSFIFRQIDVLIMSLNLKLFDIQLLDFGICVINNFQYIRFQYSNLLLVMFHDYKYE